VIGAGIQVPASPPPTTTLTAAPAAAATQVAPTTVPQTTSAPTTTPTTTTRPRTTRPLATRPPATRPPAPALTVVITSLPATGQGNAVSATAQTLPRARCSIDVVYKSGPSTAQGLDPKTASRNGDVAWTWLVGARTTPGNWPVMVTCSKAGATKSATRYLTVIDTGNPG
jgi:hypothetical protein